MTTFYFVRHGETTINKAQCFNGGGVDSALTPAGLAAADRLGDYLGDQIFDAILTSPLQRAQTTAEHLLAQSRVVQPALTIAPQLREMALGDWEAQPVAAQEKHLQFDNYFHHPDLFEADQIHAESYQAVLDRAMTVIDQAQQAYPEGNVLIVAHGIVLLFVMGTLLGVPFSAIRDQKMVANASLSILEGHGQPYEKVLWNKTV